MKQAMFLAGAILSANASAALEKIADCVTHYETTGDCPAEQCYPYEKQISGGVYSAVYASACANAAHSQSDCDNRVAEDCTETANCAVEHELVDDGHEETYESYCVFKTEADQHADNVATANIICGIFLGVGAALMIALGIYCCSKNGGCC